MPHHATPAALLDTFARDRGSDPFHTGFYTLLDEAPGEVPALVIGALDRPLNNPHFVGEAVSYLTLDPVPPGLEVTAVSRLTLEMCVRAVEVNEVMEYVHDAEGRPSPHRHQVPGDEPEFESVPLRAAEVRLAPTPARWFWQDWGASNDRQNLSRLGGHPSWVQSADYPPCPECGRFMTFLIQLDATLPAGRDETEQVFSEGAFYGFWCDRCRVSAFKWQIT